MVWLSNVKVVVALYVNVNIVIVIVIAIARARARAIPNEGTMFLGRHFYSHFLFVKFNIV